MAPTHRKLIQNDLVQIVHTKTGDLPFVLAAERAHARHVGQWPLARHEDALHAKDVLHLLLQKTDGQRVGYAILKGLTNESDSIELMRLVVVGKGLGYGKAALSLLKQWCFEAQKAHRLWLDAREGNLRAQHVYRSQGFVQEGILRECVKVGDGYQSLIVMAVLRQEYAAGQG
jgi:RimJ/RimL family protein N-acetyltransferase